MIKRTELEVSKYLTMLEENYLNVGRMLTDLELHNVSVKMDRALAMYRCGLSHAEIKKEMISLNGYSTPKQWIEDVSDRIQKKLIEDGFSRNSEAETRQWNDEFDLRILIEAKKFRNG